MENTITEIKKYHTRLTTVLNELEILEDWQDPEINNDWEALLVEWRDNTRILENRRETLQKKEDTYKKTGREKQYD